MVKQSGTSPFYMRQSNENFKKRIIIINNENKHVCSAFSDAGTVLSTFTNSFNSHHNSFNSHHNPLGTDYCQHAHLTDKKTEADTAK